VLYPDPVDGYHRATRVDRDSPRSRATTRAEPRPRRDRFHAGELLGSVSGELGLRKFLGPVVHKWSRDRDKAGPTHVFERELPRCETCDLPAVWPGYHHGRRIQVAKLKLALTAGIGPTMSNLQAALSTASPSRRSPTGNSISRRRARGHDDPCAVRNYIPSHQWVARRRLEHRRLRRPSYDVRGMQVGTVGGRAHRLRRPAAAEAVRGRAALHGPPQAAPEVEQEAGRDLPRGRRVAGGRLRCGHHQRAPSSRDENLFDSELLSKMKRGPTW